jgi:hypothetical protein
MKRTIRLCCYHSRPDDAFGQSNKVDKTDAAIKQEIIKQSIASYRLQGKLSVPLRLDSVNGA